MTSPEGRITLTLTGPDATLRLRTPPLDPTALADNLHRLRATAQALVDLTDTRRARIDTTVDQTLVSTDLYLKQEHP